MNFKLIRDRLEHAHTGGKLYLDGDFFSWTLEPAPPIVPVGIYEVELTVSPQAQKGELWSPDSEHRLPLVLHVPGHEGIRFHAGNFPKDTQGCILVGDMRSYEAVYQSRPALSRLISRFTSPCQLEIVEEGDKSNG